MIDVDWYIEHSGEGFKWEVTHKPKYTNPWTREQAEQLKKQITDDYRDINRINDMMVELEIKPPLELWLASSITWRKKSQKYDEYNKPYKMRITYQILEKENEKNKEKVDRADGIIDAHIKKMDKLQYEIKQLKEQLETEVPTRRKFQKELDENKEIIQKLEPHIDSKIFKEILKEKK